MITPDEMTAMKEAQVAAMPSSWSVIALTRVADGTGGYGETTTVTGPFSGRLAPVRGNEPQIAEGPRSTAECILSYDRSDATLLSASRVRFGGIDYEVVYVEDDRAWLTAGRAWLRRVA
jgi:hypothetical protein